MRLLILIYIESIFDGNDLRIKINKFVIRFVKGVDIIVKKIFDFINVDVELIKNIKEEI